MKTKPLKAVSLEEITDRYIGKKGTPKREAFEQELRMDLLGEAIKDARKKRELAQDTIIKVFRALNAKISFSIELMDHKVRHLI